MGSFNKNFSIIKWSEVKKISLITFEFVGYGLRFSLKYGQTHIVKGNKGLLIETLNGSKYLLGTQKSDEMKKVIAKINEEIIK